MNPLPAILLTLTAGATLPVADEPAPLRFTTSWVGNTFGGGPDWVQNQAESIQVLADGTVVVGSFWDEAGREVGLYKDGRVVGQLPDTHMRGGFAVAANDTYLFYAHTCAIENQSQPRAGEAPRDKPLCHFGVSRYLRDGKHAPFPGGTTRFQNMLSFREAPDNHALIPRGLAADGTHLFVADTAMDLVRVVDPAGMRELRTFPVPSPGKLAVDPSGDLWIVCDSGRRVARYSSDGTCRIENLALPEGTVPNGLGFDREGHLLVCDRGPGQQVLVVDATRTPTVVVERLGEPGGMFGGPDPGSVGAWRFANPTGAGTDAAGNLYIACNVPRGGTVLRSFTPDRKPRWELLGLEFLDVADADPTSDGRDLYTADDRYAFDPSAPAGKNWRWAAHTLDPQRYPDDLRLHLPGLQCATLVRDLNGHRFLCQRGMWQGVLGIYRLVGNVAVPAVVLSSGPLKAEGGAWSPAGQPASGRWFWRDSNGNGRMEPGEYTPTTGPEGEYWASHVDARGDIWQAGRDTGIWHWRFLGLDDHGVPRYDPEAEHRPMPEPFTDLLRTDYQPETDTMYLSGQTKDRPITHGEWGTAGTVVARFDHWSTAPQLRYRTDLPYTPESCLPESLCVAGDLFFVVECKTAEVWVFDNRDGRKLGTLRPGPEVHGQSGWVDFRDAIRAVQRKDGSYLVFVEEDWKAKVLVYHLAPDDSALAGQRFLVTSVRTGDTEVFLVDPVSGDATNLTRSPRSEERYPCWSPDGRQIAFTSDRDGAYNLYAANADGSHVRKLTELQAPAVAYMPSWVGEKIVFGLHAERPEIAQIQPDGSGLKILGAGHDPVLAPDGRTIAFTGEAPGGVTVFLMDADGSNRRQLVPEANDWGAVFPAWSPDGSQIVYSFRTGEALELFVVAADGSSPPRQLTRLGGISTPADWSPDGRWISFRHTDEAYWRNPERVKAVYRDKPGDKRPVWVIRPDGSAGHVVECLRYQCAMDGSRAAWCPIAKPPSGP